MIDRRRTPETAPSRIRIDHSLPFGGVGERLYRTLGFAGPTGTDVTDRDDFLDDGPTGGTHESFARK